MSAEQADGGIDAVRIDVCRVVSMVAVGSGLVTEGNPFRGPDRKTEGAPKDPVPLTARDFGLNEAEETPIFSERCCRG